ncbi:MAG: cupin domain-containing protein [Rhizobiales bacterium]|nr:cupin domain-containing protein [Hyphomicrobiales bacterium]
MKPVINIDQLEFEDDGENIPSKSAGVSNLVGAKNLEYNISICPPGKSTCPMHNHHIGEEMFMILEGEGKLRFGKSEHPLRKGDIIGCPPGGQDVAHQIINTGTVDLKYLSLSTTFVDDIVEYPDSNKIGVFSLGTDGARIKKIFKADSDVDYYEGETDDILYK